MLIPVTTKHRRIKTPTTIRMFFNAFIAQSPDIYFEQFLPFHESLHVAMPMALFNQSIALMERGTLVRGVSILTGKLGTATMAWLFLIALITFFVTSEATSILVPATIFDPSNM